MVKGSRLTSLGIERARAKGKEVWLTDDEGSRGGGRLVVRIGLSGSKQFYFRYYIDGKATVMPLRPFASAPTEGRYTLEQARQVARSYSELHRSPEARDIAVYLAQKREAEHVERAAEAAREQEVMAEAARASQFTLKALCLAYVTHLEALGKVSAPNVKSGFKCHVYGTEWADKPAKHFTAKHAAALLRGIMRKGAGRTASKVRSYLQTAFSLAMTAETDASAPPELILFGIEANPIAGTAALSQFSQPRKRALSPSEMGAFWQALWPETESPSLPVRALRLTLLLGGQRGQQLLRVRLSEVELHLRTILLHDPKGRRTEPRPHLLPLEGKAEKEVQFLVERSKALDSPWLFASTKTRNGEPRHLGSEMLSKTVAAMSKTFIENGTSTQPFGFSDLRRTAETLQASRGVKPYTRAQIQSHGISGIQARHYDLYEYMDEKKSTLRAWHAHLDRMAAGDYECGDVQMLSRAAQASPVRKQEPPAGESV